MFQSKELSFTRQESRQLMQSSEKPQDQGQFYSAVDNTNNRHTCALSYHLFVRMQLLRIVCPPQQDRKQNSYWNECNIFQTALKNPYAHALEHSWQCKLCPWSHSCFELASLSISAIPIKPPLSLSKRFSTEICRSIKSIIPAASYVSQSSSHCYCLRHRVLLCYFSSNRAT